MTSSSTTRNGLRSSREPYNRPLERTGFAGRSPVALYAYAVELSCFERWEGLEDRWYER
jgi:hypothetical protein